MPGLVSGLEMMCNRAAGAEIAPDAKSVFDKAEMIVKVKEPQPGEWAQLSADQILFTYLHLAADPVQTRGLMESGCTAIAYETITDDQGGLPLLAPMSEVAGRLAVIEGAANLKANAGGSRSADFWCSGNVPCGCGCCWRWCCWRERGRKWRLVWAHVSRFSTVRCLVFAICRTFLATASPPAIQAGPSSRKSAVMPIWLSAPC